MLQKKEKEEREKRLIEILKQTSLEHNKKYLNKEFEVLVEKEDNEVYFGKTRTLKNVKFKSNQKDLVGKVTKVKITKANIWSLEGESA